MGRQSKSDVEQMIQYSPGSSHNSLAACSPLMILGLIRRCHGVII